MKVNSRFIDNETDSTYISPENEKMERKKKYLPKINKTMRVFQKEKENDKDEEIKIKINNPYKFEIIDYAKKVKEAKEMEDLQKIYDLWLANRGLRRGDDDYELDLLRFKINEIGKTIKRYKTKDKDGTSKNKKI